MDYIINPMWFYWVQIFSGIGVLAAVLTIILSITFIIGVIDWMICKVSYRDYPSISEKEKHRYLALEKLFKPFVIALSICAVVCIVSPSKETMISMMVAKYATHTNAQLTVDAIKSAVDYIVQAIKSIN